MHIFKITQSLEYHQLILSANNQEDNLRNLAIYQTLKKKKSIINSLEKKIPSKFNLCKPRRGKEQEKQT